MTWYLKYRPQKIAELDLHAVSEHLGKILSSGSLPHAFLFAGPRGIGKTSAARILAKVVNGNDKDLNLEIEAGAALDVIEIDAASNRGIDEIRDLREKIKLSPIAAKYKVYIIDEVHMLTTEAFNALLKTLEEPPAHAVFVLCTTEVEKLPETIVSRCTLVKFARPKTSEIVAKLEIVVKGEKLKVKDPELQLIAQAARGSFRDAIKILEQVSLSGQPVAQVLGMLESAQPEEFIQLVRDGQTQPALELIAKLVDQGGNLRGFIERCVEELREQLLTQANTEEDLKLIAAFEKAYIRSKDSAVPQLPLEILVIEMTTNPPAKRDPALQDKPPSNTPSVSPPKLGGEKKSGGMGGKFKLEDVVVKWQEILKAVRPKNHSVEALLRSTRPLDFDGQLLVLEVFYKFHKDKLESDKCRQIVESAVGDVLGSTGVRLQLQLGQRIKQEEISAEAIEDDIVKAAEEIFKVDAI